MMRWGMLPPPRSGGPPVTNIRNTSSIISSGPCLSEVHSLRLAPGRQLDDATMDMRVNSRRVVIEATFSREIRPLPQGERRKLAMTATRN
jgi:hypothetical protein